jgi:hypothetical protein
MMFEPRARDEQQDNENDEALLASCEDKYREKPLHPVA